MQRHQRTAPAACLIVSSSLCLIVLLLLSAGCGARESPPAGATLQQQFQAAMADPNAAVRADALARIGYQQYQAGDRAGAKHSYAEAASAAQSIDDPYRRGLAWSLLATAEARSGDTTAARQSLARAKAAIPQTERPENRVDLAARVATVFARELRDPASAAAVLQEAESLVPSISTPQDQVTALSTLLAAYHAAGKASDADRLTRTIGQTISTISQPRRQVDALAAFAQALISAARADEGREQLAAALNLAHQIDDPYGKTFSLAAVSEHYLKAGLASEARNALDEAATAAAAIPQSDLRREAEQRIKDIAANLPRPRPAKPGPQ